jgi:hypothetical protein
MNDAGERKKPANEDGQTEADKPVVKLAGVVEKIVKPVVSTQPELAQIAIAGGEDLYKEIRIENNLQTTAGVKVKLKPGDAVDVTIEAPENSGEKKKPA